MGVVIIDVRGSVGRPQVSVALKRLVDDLQTTVPTGLLQVVWGDEVEGVLPFPLDLWDLYLRTRTSLGDLPFYMGVGFGQLTDDLRPGADTSIHELNGTAFKAARHALEHAKQGDWSAMPLAFTVHDSPLLTRALNGYPRMLNAAMRRMTRKQRAYFEDRVAGYSQAVIAERHGVHQATVARELKRAGADQLTCMRDGLAALLQFIGRFIQWGGGPMGGA